MRSYVKAYLYRELREFPQLPSLVANGAPELGDDDIVYVAEDFSVLTDPIAQTGVVVDEPTEQWRKFCADSLDFAVPDDLAPTVAETPVKTPVVQQEADPVG